MKIILPSAKTGMDTILNYKGNALKIAGHTGHGTVKPASALQTAQAEFSLSPLTFNYNVGIDKLKIRMFAHGVAVI